MQTFAPHIQRAIGRIQPIEEIACAVGQLRAALVSSINFDLMYGLPRQIAADLDETLDIALEMRPQRLAVFGYAHVPHLLPRQRQIDARQLPDAAARFAMAGQAHARLTQAGYQSVGFDHFALPEDSLARAARNGMLHRNFQGFTDDRAEVLIGLGASAISAFPDALLQNEKNAGRYHLRIASGQFATARGVKRSATDRLRAGVIEALLCRDAADCAGLPDLPGIRIQLAPFEVAGLVDWTGTTLTLPATARPYARAIAATIDPYRRASPARFSSAV